MGSYLLFALWTFQWLLLHFSGSVANGGRSKFQEAHNREWKELDEREGSYPKLSVLYSQVSLPRNHSSEAGSFCNVLFSGIWTELSLKFPHQPE